MTVYLVGAGPGDPELITLRGVRLLASADVVVHDRLVDPRLLAEARPDAEVIDVGKSLGEDADAAQRAIETILVDRGRRGLAVVRLKSGDPFLFGRGGEELAALAEAGVDVEVVPGVTTALGAPALAGVPVTHRGLSSSVRVLSGHDPAGVDWAAHARLPGTIVLLMAAARRGEIAVALIAGGRRPDEPVAVIERCGDVRERQWVTTLARLGDEAVTAPAVIVVGQVAALARTRLPAS